MVNGMDLLERYLQAVGQYLPAATKDDTLAELRANLLEQMDARVEELGRPLNDGDVAAILRQHGKPELVALRYLPQRSLIGPTIFPFYEFTLVKVLPLVVFVYAITRGIVFITAPHGSPGQQLVKFAFGLIPTVLIFWASVTIVFAIIERTRYDDEFRAEWNKWDPMKLPAVKKHAAGCMEPKSMVKRVIDLVFHCLWMAYILWVPWHPFWIMGPGVFYLDSLGVTLAPAWHTFYLLLIALLTVQLAAKLLAFVPAAQGWLKPMEFLAHVLGAAGLGWMAFTPAYFVAASAAADLHKIAVVNHSMSIAFRIAVLFAAIGLVSDAWKYAKGWVPTERLAF